MAADPEYEQIINCLVLLKWKDRLRQEDSPSPLLFNVMLEKVTRAAEIGTINWVKLLLAYADDVHNKEMFGKMKTGKEIRTNGE